ncbi:MAG TPA: hypothetical protein PL033_20005 [Candidatus Brocadiia bacterium]|nr:hypothetical protein [Candidatus Brocadiia bacterium]
MNSIVSAIIPVLCGMISASPAAPTFQELMNPDVFPNAQRGLVVESAKAYGGTIRVVTTGADIVIQLAEGTIVFNQRIGSQRPVAKLGLGRALSKAEITHSGPGFARIVVADPPMTIRVNGDSLFMLHAHTPITARVEREIPPAWVSTYETHHIICDELGGFGLYCSNKTLKENFDEYADTVAAYPLQSDDVLWVGVCPPKPYDWERSLKENVVWHWSNQLGYPPDDALRAWKPHGQIVLLQSEVMLWKDWNLDFVPRLGVEEFARVRKTLHDMGMRFIVYTSPTYFLKGTELEKHAFNSFEGFTNWPPGTTTGENMELFLSAITRVMKEYKPDGLYFDGQYIANPAALYALARRSREIVGENGILEWHSTFALGFGECQLPQADAYVDYLLRGEGQEVKCRDFDYMRFFVSGYNIHNCVGVVCNNGSEGITPQLALEALRANARFHMLASWLANDNFIATWRRDYKPHLDPGLRKKVDRLVAERQAAIPVKIEAARKERDALAKEPDWKEPTLRLDFNEMPKGDVVASPANADPLAVADGILKIRARASTYAFLRVPLKAQARGMIVKIRHSSDGGMSWGPGAMIRWKEKTGIRVGTRSDGNIQSDILGMQKLAPGLDAGRWIWLRARWLGRQGVVERSLDGKSYEVVWHFDHNGFMSREPVELLVGKVPFNGEAQDFSDPGNAGACEIDFVEVY